MLIDMKYTPKEKLEESKENVPGPDSMPDYPYGLTINLEKEQLDKLGLTEYEVGDELNMSGVCKITMVRSSERENDPEEASVCIQIMKLELTDADEMAEAVEAKGSAKTTLTNMMR